jgi:hypothetical protein
MRVNGIARLAVRAELHAVALQLEAPHEQESHHPEEDVRHDDKIDAL